MRNQDMNRSVVRLVVAFLAGLLIQLAGVAIYRQMIWGINQTSMDGYLIIIALSFPTSAIGFAIARWKLKIDASLATLLGGGFLIVALIAGAAQMFRWVPGGLAAVTFPTLLLFMTLSWSLCAYGFEKMMFHKTKSSVSVDRRQGFTLIELLCVVAIIGALAAILFPILTQAKNEGHSTHNLSNLRQVGLAVLMYQDSHDGRELKNNLDPILETGLLKTFEVYRAKGDPYPEGIGVIITRSLCKPGFITSAAVAEICPLIYRVPTSFETPFIARTLAESRWATKCETHAILVNRVTSPVAKPSHPGPYSIGFAALSGKVQGFFTDGSAKAYRWDSLRFIDENGTPTNTISYPGLFCPTLNSEAELRFQAE